MEGSGAAAWIVVDALEAGGVAARWHELQPLHLRQPARLRLAHRRWGWGGSGGGSSGNGGCAQVPSISQRRLDGAAVVAEVMQLPALIDLRLEGSCAAVWIVADALEAAGAAARWHELQPLHLRQPVRLRLAHRRWGWSGRDGGGGGGGGGNGGRAQVLRWRIRSRVQVRSHQSPRRG